MTQAEYMRKIMDELNGVSSIKEGPQNLMEGYESIKEAQSWAQQAAIADDIKNIFEGPNDSPLTFQGTKKWKNEKDFFKKWFSRPFLTHEK